MRSYGQGKVEDTCVTLLNHRMTPYMSVLILICVRGTVLYIKSEKVGVLRSCDHKHGMSLNQFK
jgi:hypothetical protein